MLMKAQQEKPVDVWAVGRNQLGESGARPICYYRQRNGEWVKKFDGSSLPVGTFAWPYSINLDALYFNSGFRNANDPEGKIYALGENRLSESNWSIEPASYRISIWYSEDFGATWNYFSLNYPGSHPSA